MDPLTAARLFWAGAHGLVSLEVAGQFVMGRPIKILVPVLIETLHTGMGYYEPRATHHSSEDSHNSRSQATR